MNLKNRSVIRKLSFKTLWASRKRNLIAVIAIALTALLFTSLFTILLSINSSYQNYTFRQIGGYSHGSFKEVNEQQIAALSTHPKIKASGVRQNIGMFYSGVFSKTPVEISFMDETCARWSWAVPTTGGMPEAENEIAMDTAALALLGVEPELGAEITLTYLVSDLNSFQYEKTDTFQLSGWWDYDPISPVHYLNVSRAYAEAMTAEAVELGYPAFRTDLNVMLWSSLDIEGQLQQIDQDLGYTWDKRGAENNVRYGVNWGYTSEQLLSFMDGQMVLSLAAFLLLIVFTGYLIIYNIFRISVTGDIRFYGLLKTIGVTPRQLKRIIRWQALCLCFVGIPVGLVLGYGVGAALVPAVMSATAYAQSFTVSASPWIFLLSACFALGTVLLSCARPGKIASKVSPVEAVRYTQQEGGGKKKKTIGVKVFQMALANLGRSKGKTALVVVSLSLAVVLLNILTMFVGGFDMEKYLSYMTCADFIVSSPSYFNSTPTADFFSPEDLQVIRENTESSFSGIGYHDEGYRPVVYMEEENWISDASRYMNQQELAQQLAFRPRNGNLVGQESLLYSCDPQLFEKMTVVEGDLSPLFREGSNAIALSVYTDDFGNVSNRDFYPAIGASLTVEYVESMYYIDSRTGEPADENTTPEFWQVVLEGSREVTYTVCALVQVPRAMDYRYSTLGYELVLPVERMTKDSGMSAIPMVYVFDTPNSSAEEEAEALLAELCEDPLSPLMYESKATKREEFQKYQSMFALLGGMLCAIIGIVGILNFFNAIMTGILSRQREFAVLQAVGMTGKQLKAMLVYEGLFYAMGAALLALLLSLVLNPLVENVLETMFWFFTGSFTILPVLLVLPVFCLLGWSIPAVMYHHTKKQSIVQRLRISE